MSEVAIPGLPPFWTVRSDGRAIELMRVDPGMRTVVIAPISPHQALRLAEDLLASARPMLERGPARA